MRGQRADNTTPTRRLCADKLCQVVFEVVLSSLKMKVVSFGEKFRNLFRDKRCFTKGVGKVTLRDGHQVMYLWTQNTLPYYLVDWSGLIPHAVGPRPGPPSPLAQPPLAPPPLARGPPSPLAQPALACAAFIEKVSIGACSGRFIGL